MQFNLLSGWGAWIFNGDFGGALCWVYLWNINLMSWKFKESPWISKRTTMAKIFTLTYSDMNLSIHSKINIQFVQCTCSNFYYSMETFPKTMTFLIFALNPKNTIIKMLSSHSNITYFYIVRFLCLIEIFYVLVAGDFDMTWTKQEKVEPIMLPFEKFNELKIVATSCKSLLSRNVFHPFSKIFNIHSGLFHPFSHHSNSEKAQTNESCVVFLIKLKTISQ